MARSQYMDGFSVTVEADRDPSLIRVEGDLDSFAAAGLREGFGRVLGRPGAIVDIREVPFVDSSGLGALVGGIRRMREAGGTVAVCCTRPSVLRLLALTGVDRAVAVAESPDEAVTLIATGSGTLDS